MESKRKMLEKQRKVSYRKRVKIGDRVYKLKSKGYNVCAVVGCKRRSSMLFIDSDEKNKKVVISLCPIHSIFDEIF